MSKKRSLVAQLVASVRAGFADIGRTQPRSGKKGLKVKTNLHGGGIDVNSSRRLLVLGVVR